MRVQPGGLIHAVAEECGRGVDGVLRVPQVPANVVRELLSAPRVMFQS